MQIKILGPGCTTCRRLYAETEGGVALSGQPASITKVEAMEDIVADAIFRTPGLVITGKVVASASLARCRSSP